MSTMAANGLGRASTAAVRPGRAALRRRTAVAGSEGGPFVGIMQGRLSPPRGGRIQSFPAETWREEFSSAGAAGLAGIEWIIEDREFDHANPLSTDLGVAELLSLAEQTGVRVISVCADGFMNTRLVHTDGWLNRPAVHRLNWLLERSAAAGAGWIVLPFVDAAGLSSTAEQAGLRRLLEDVLPRAEAAGVALHLETDLPPRVLAGLMREFDNPLLRAMFDTGNSASLGYDPNREIPLLAPWLGSVHIKDRRRGGGTVPLGTGHTAFATIFARLAEAGYAAPYVLQAARGAPGREVDLARQQLAWLLNCLAVAQPVCPGR